jgi:hypothetical protein
MSHAELFQDVAGRYRWLAVEEGSDGTATTVSQQTFSSAEEAYADALRLPLTIVPNVRESDRTREVSHEQALISDQEDQTPTE